LAALYGVPTFRFNEAVKRNRNRFPEDFMFQLTRDEASSLTSQFAMSKSRRGGRRKGGALVPPERIERSILLIRGHKVMLDTDLAALYGVETGQLVRAVKRNISRFPHDFMFQLSKDEF
jgi:hypothetical protein